MLLGEVPPPVVAWGAQALVSFGTLITAIFLWGLHGSMPSFVRTLINNIARTQHTSNNFAYVVTAPSRAAVSVAKWLYHQVHHHVSHATVLKSKPLEGWLYASGTIWQAHVNQQARTAEATADAFWRFRHNVMPSYVRARVVPVRHIAVHAQATAHSAQVGAAAANRALGHKGIDKLRRDGLWPVAVGLGVFDAFRLRTHRQLKDISAETKQNAKAAAHAQTTARAASRSAARANARAKNLARTKVDKKTLAVATEAAIALRFGGAFRCRDLKSLTRMLRCSHWRFLRDLLALGLAYLAVTDPVVIAKTAVKTEELLDGTLRELANPTAAATEASHLLADLLVGGVN